MLQVSTRAGATHADTEEAAGKWISRTFATALRGTEERTVKVGTHVLMGLLRRNYICLLSTSYVWLIKINQILIM